MKRFAVNKTLAVSASAATNTMPIGILTAASRAAEVYDVVCGMNAAVADAQLITGLQLASTYVAGTAFTANPLEAGDAASITTATTTLTVGSQTLSGTPFIQLPWNSRGTIRYYISDPDSRIKLAPGGATNGALIMYNQQPGTVASIVADNTLFFME